LVAVDYEGGRVQRFRKGGFTVLPPARVFGRIYDEDPARAISLARSCGWLIGHARVSSFIRELITSTIFPAVSAGVSVAVSMTK